MDGAAFRVRDGRLHVEELACTELAARFGAPLYVMSETRLRSNARRLGAALAAGWPLGRARLLPSIRANPALATRAVLTSEGAGRDTFGETELEMALRAGVPPALSSVNGASKSAALIRRAVAAGARLTLDSARQLPMARPTTRPRRVVSSPAWGRAPRRFRSEVNRAASRYVTRTVPSPSRGL